MAVLLVTSNKSRRLLCVSYIGRMRPEEFQRSHEQLMAQLGEMSPGFCLLVDFSHLEFIGLDCQPELGRMMGLIGRAGVGWVARVIPDPSKDIGMNILTAFHYPHRFPVVTCKSLVEAARALGL